MIKTLTKDELNSYYMEKLVINLMFSECPNKKELIKNHISNKDFKKALLSGINFYCENNLINQDQKENIKKVLNFLTQIEFLPDNDLKMLYKKTQDATNMNATQFYLDELSKRDPKNEFLKYGRRQEKVKFATAVQQDLFRSISTDYWLLGLLYDSSKEKVARKICRNNRFRDQYFIDSINVILNEKKDIIKDNTKVYERILYLLNEIESYYKNYYFHIESNLAERASMTRDDLYELVDDLQNSLQNRHSFYSPDSYKTKVLKRQSFKL